MAAREEGAALGIERAPSDSSATRVDAAAHELGRHEQEEEEDGEPHPAVDDPGDTVEAGRSSRRASAMPSGR